MIKTENALISRSLYSLLCFAMIIMTIGLKNYVQLPVFLFSLIGFSLLCILLIVFTVIDQVPLAKLTMLSIVFLSVAFVGYVSFYSTGLITNLKDIEAITEFVRSTKQWGIIIYIVIVVFQVLFLPIPGILPAILGTALYGPFWAFVFMSAGTIFGSILAFALGKIFGKKLIVWMIGEEKTEKYATIINDKGKFIFIVMLVFPFFPDDILCMVAGLTKMSYKYFIIAVSLTRPIMIAFYCFLGSGQIIPFTGWGIPVWIALFVSLVALLFLLNKLKSKIAAKFFKDKPKKSDETK